MVAACALAIDNLFGLWASSFHSSTTFLFCKRHKHWWLVRCTREGGRRRVLSTRVPFIYHIFCVLSSTSTTTTVPVLPRTVLPVVSDLVSTVARVTLACASRRVPARRQAARGAEGAAARLVRHECPLDRHRQPLVRPGWRHPLCDFAAGQGVRIGRARAARFYYTMAL